MRLSQFMIALTTAATVALSAGAAAAQEVVKIGMSFAMTGAGFAAAGRQASAGARLYLQHHGNMVAGKKIEIILRDDAGVADNARRLVQEMIVNDKVHIIAGGITPTVLAYGPLVTQAKIATVVMISGASVTTTASPYFVRTSFILAQSSWIMGEWAAKNGSKRVVTLVNEWAPGTEAETAFKQRRKRRLSPEHMHRTRMVPKRSEELRDGGSLYWVIRGEIAAREKIIALEPFRDKDGIGRCRLVMQPKVIAVSPRPMRPFQGWRYLTDDAAPPDLGKAAEKGVAAMPEPLRRELRDLGLL